MFIKSTEHVPKERLRVPARPRFYRLNGKRLPERACCLGLALCSLLAVSSTRAWFDKTHLAVARAAGFDSWYNAAGPDLAKIKAGNGEAYNHWYNNLDQAEVTERMVMDQIPRYNRRSTADSEGHLYGAIIASLRGYREKTAAGKYAEYHLAFCAHYIGDLSQPLHNIPFDDYNKAFHGVSDGIVEQTIFYEPQKIARRMYLIKLGTDTFEADLAKHIARIAELSRKLGNLLRSEKRNITRQEAYQQLGHSASLLKAVLAVVRK
jgi:hypothetical protein